MWDSAMINNVCTAHCMGYVVKLFLFLKDEEIILRGICRPEVFMNYQPSTGFSSERSV